MIKAAPDKPVRRKRWCIRPFCYDNSKTSRMKKNSFSRHFPADSTGLAMKFKPALKFFLFQAIAVFFAEANADPATFSRSSYFTKRENSQLKEYVVKRFVSPSLLLCDQQCMRYAWCSSTNYKMSFKKDGKGTCELNKHDISLIDENAELIDQQGVTFSMPLKVKKNQHIVLRRQFSCLNDTNNNNELKIKATKIKSQLQRYS